jgi:hypothetical protein
MRTKSCLVASCSVESGPVASGPVMSRLAKSSHVPFALRISDASFFSLCSNPIHASADQFMTVLESAFSIRIFSSLGTVMVVLTQSERPSDFFFRPVNRLLIAITMGPGKS